MIRMRTLLAGAAGAALALTATAVQPVGAGLADSPVVTIKGYDADRTDDIWGWYEECLDETRAFVGDPASFGPSGVIDVNFETLPGVNVVTETNLDDTDIFFTGWVETDTYTADEKAAILDYVMGGGAFIATTDGTDHNLADIFGVTLADDGSTNGVVTDPDHPITDGPFGAQGTFELSGDIGHYTDLGPAHELGENDEGPAMAIIEPGELGPGSGPVFLVADVDFFTNDPEECTGGELNAEINEVLIKNLFAYLSGGEPPVPPTTPTTAAPTTSTTARPASTTTPRFTG
jgi:hypothetical protein